MSGLHHLRRPDRATSAAMLASAHALADDPPASGPEEDEWTAARLSQAARVACSRVRVSADSAREIDMLGVALSGVGLAVAIDPHCAWSDAVAAGQRELWDAVSAVRQSYGLDTQGDHRPRFIAYWLDETTTYPKPSSCEFPMTVRQVLNALPARHLETLFILAFTDSMQQAAEVAGVGVHTFRCRVTTARRAALALWFDHETPPELSRLPINRRGRDRTCPKGHPISGDNAWQVRRHGRVVETCRTCRIKRNRKTKAKEKVAA